MADLTGQNHRVKRELYGGNFHVLENSRNLEMIDPCNLLEA